MFSGIALVAGSITPLSCNNQKYLRTWPSVPWRAKSPLAENHCCKLLCSAQPHGMWCRKGVINPTERGMPGIPNSRLSTVW